MGGGKRQFAKQLAPDFGHSANSCVGFVRSVMSDECRLNSNFELFRLRIRQFQGGGILEHFSNIRILGPDIFHALGKIVAGILHPKI
jgi:hypothetical protein